MDEEEDEEERGHEEVHGFEEFVEAVARRVQWEGSPRVKVDREREGEGESKAYRIGPMDMNIIHD